MHTYTPSEIKKFAICENYISKENFLKERIYWTNKQATDRLKENRLTAFRGVGFEKKEKKREKELIYMDNSMVIEGVVEVANGIGG